MKLFRARVIVLTLLIAPCFALPLRAYHPSKQEVKAAAKRAIKAFFGKGSKIVQGSQQIGTLDDPRLTESSGIAASRRNPGVLYTHNDSGDGPNLFAINRQGHTLVCFKLKNAVNVDWEDIAVGPSAVPGRTGVYLADTGNNRLDRRVMTIYRVDEPAISTGKNPNPNQELGGVETFRFRYPDGNHDCETLMVHPRTGQIVLVTKEADGHSRVFTLPSPLNSHRVMTAIRTASLTLTNSIFSGDNKYARGERQATGGDISPDGTRMVVRTYLRGYQWHLEANGNIARAFSVLPKVFLLPLTRQGEGIGYRHDNQAILITSEGRNSPLFEIAVP